LIKNNPIFALVGDDRIPKDAKLITEWWFYCLYCPYWRIVSRGKGGVVEMLKLLSQRADARQYFLCRNWNLKAQYGFI